jgi:putative heme-binding domain-containing protein
MAAPTTSNDFLDVVRKSKQIDPTRLDACLSKHSDRTLPAEPKRLAALLIREGLITTFQAEQFLQGKYKGFHLGGYRLIDRIGTGGTGTVYLAEHEVMHRSVALKVLAPALANDPPTLERFRREAQAVAALNHPNIVRANDFRQEGTVYFLVMEYIDGPSLQTILQRQGPLPLDLACDYVRQAAIALQHAHQANLVHRDIKPANLLVNKAGVIKVLDLGLARFAPEGEESLTRKFDQNVVMGTADYLAPEQALHLHDADLRADIYSLGATFYALLAGEPPFPEGTAAQKLLWHQMRTPEPIHERRPDVPVAVSEIIATMMAKLPADRMQSCAEVAVLLEPWCSRVRDEPSEEAAAEKIIRARDDSSNPALRGVLVGTAFLAVLGLIVGGVLAVLFWGGPGSSTTSTSAPEASKPAEEDWPTRPLLAERRKVAAQLQHLTTTRGDLGRGKQVFAKHCARCHAPPGGPRIGPDLTEFATHSREELLDRILVPRRTSLILYQVSTLTTKDGEVFTGVVVSRGETAIDVIDAQTKRTTLQRSQVAESVPSKRSLMPYDFDKQLKPDEITDLLAFLTDTGKYRPVPLDNVATAVSTRGMFYSQTNETERMVFLDWKPKWFEGVPFVLVDPRGESQNNVVLLYGPQGTVPPTMPRSVSLPCNTAVKKVHLLGGVSGWGYPYGNTRSVSMIVRLNYKDGKTEDHELKNGEHLADYIRREDVPGSRFAFDLGGRQLRYLAIHAERNELVDTIELIKGPDQTAPLVMAVTVETP